VTLSQTENSMIVVQQEFPVHFARFYKFKDMVDLQQQFLTASFIVDVVFMVSHNVTCFVNSVKEVLETSKNDRRTVYLQSQRRGSDLASVSR